MLVIDYIFYLTFKIILKVDCLISSCISHARYVDRPSFPMMAIFSFGMLVFMCI